LQANPSSNVVSNILGEAQLQLLWHLTLSKTNLHCNMVEFEYLKMTMKQPGRFHMTIRGFCKVVFPMSLMCFKNLLSFLPKLDLKLVNTIKTSVNIQKDECE